MMLYRFDKKLRLLMFNEKEKIEIAASKSVKFKASKALKDAVK